MHKNQYITFNGEVNLILNFGALLALNTFTKQDISLSVAL